jgi:predicted ArsR family transcriptional regulator
MDIDKVIHQPIRTKILAYLTHHGRCDYVTLKKQLGLTDGHMTTHMRELIGKTYVEVEKSFVNNKPKTTYTLSALGKQRFQEYISTLQSILNG